jgi:hypothetical protein
MNDAQVVTGTNGVNYTFKQLWLMTIGYAAIKLANAFQFRGHPPKLLGSRAAARSRGFMNAAHERRVLAEKEKKLFDAPLAQLEAATA